ncbi:MAG: pilus assembly protein CpaC [Arenicella sp.]
MKINKNRLLANLTCSFVCFFVVLSSSANEKQSDLDLEIGDVKILDVGEVTRVAIGNDDLVSISVMQTGKMMVIPKSPGKTQIKVWKTGERLIEFSVSIFPKDMSAVLAEIKSVVADYEDISARIVSDKIILEGSIDPTELNGFDAVISVFPSVVSLVTEKRSKKEMLRLKVQVLEIDKRYRKEIGIQWGDSANGPVIGTIGNIVDNNFYRLQSEDPLTDFGNALGLIPIGDNTFYPYAGLASSLTSRIQLVQENGAGRILAEPTLSTQSGTSASFLAGGEIPYATVNEQGQTIIQFRQYGIQLEILPEIDSRGNIISDVVAEVSSVDAGVSIQGVPGLLTRRTQSTVSLRPGQTIAISGLLSTNENRNTDSIPLLGDIPVLGRLFGSKSLQEQRTEIIFLVTPEIVDEDSEPLIDPGLRKQLEDMQQVMADKNAFQDQLAE